MGVRKSKCKYLPFKIENWSEYPEISTTTWWSYHTNIPHANFHDWIRRRHIDFEKHGSMYFIDQHTIKRLIAEYNGNYTIQQAPKMKHWDNIGNMNIVRLHKATYSCNACEPYNISKLISENEIDWSALSERSTCAEYTSQIYGKVTQTLWRCVVIGGLSHYDFSPCKLIHKKDMMQYFCVNSEGKFVGNEMEIKYKRGYKHRF